MNKLLIVLLAVCLFSVVSAHTFVKRDAPATDDMAAKLKALQDQLTKLGNEFGKTIADSVNPDTIKKNVNDFIDAAAKTAHAFVKRDAPATPDVTAQLKAFQEQFAQLASEFSKKITESVNPDTIKKNVNDFIDAAAKTAQNFKPVTDDKPAA